VSAQDLLDRVLARVNGQPITMSDTRAAIALGIVEQPKDVDPILSALRQLVERRLVLDEVARFAPPEPDPASLEGQINALRARVGSPAAIAELEKTTGVGEEQIREIARDNLRIQSYLNQRFGSSVQVTDEDVAQYYRRHQDEFRVNGQLQPFAEAESIARQKAAAERRQAIIFQWMRELRQRADVAELYRK
jgi:peptidyl-prolyl cis-trans isomerase C